MLAILAMPQQPKDPRLVATHPLEVVDLGLLSELEMPRLGTTHAATPRCKRGAGFSPWVSTLAFNNHGGWIGLF